MYKRGDNADGILRVLMPFGRRRLDMPSVQCRPRWYLSWLSEIFTDQNIILALPKFPYRISSRVSAMCVRRYFFNGCPKNLAFKFYYDLSLQAVVEPYLLRHREIFYHQNTLKITTTMRIVRTQFGRQEPVHLRWLLKPFIWSRYRIADMTGFR